MREQPAQIFYTSFASCYVDVRQMSVRSVGEKRRLKIPAALGYRDVGYKDLGIPGMCLVTSKGVLWHDSFSEVLHSATRQVTC